MSFIPDKAVSQIAMKRMFKVGLELAAARTIRLLQ